MTEDAGIQTASPSGAPRPHGAMLRRCSKLIQRSPLWLTALVLVLLAMAVKYKRPYGWHSEVSILGSYVDLLDLLILLALFLPGPIRRGSWRQMLLAVPLSFLAMVLVTLVPAVRGKLWRAHPYNILVAQLLLIVMVALSEWAMTRPWRLRSLGFLLFFGLAAGCVVTTVQVHLEMTGWKFDTYPYINAFNEYVHVLTQPILLAVLAWVAIGLAWRVKVAGRLLRRAIIIAGVTAVAILPVFAEAVMLPLARHSVRTGSPYRRSWAAVALCSRGRQADMDILWGILDKEEWANRTYLMEEDWRFEFCRALYWNDTAGTIERLGSMLRARPRPELAVCAGAFMFHSGNYEAAPILMRYALFEDPSWPSSRRLLPVLATSRLPEALIPLLRDAKWTYGGGERDFTLPEHVHSPLVKLLGMDVGTRYASWEKLLEGLKELPSPVPQQIRTDARRTIDSFLLYVEKSNHLAEAQRRLAHKRLEIEVPKLLARVKEAEKAGTRIAPSDEALLKEYWDQAAKALKVREPNINVFATDDFVKEVENFAAGVESVVRRHLPSTTGPSSHGLPAR